MSGYRKDSPWNDAGEIACLIIFKRLEEKGFPRGMQLDLCRELARTSRLTVGSISAKVCNYKSLAGINGSSNYSNQSEHFYKKFGKLSITQLQKLDLNGACSPLKSQITS